LGVGVGLGVGVAVGFAVGLAVGLGDGDALGLPDGLGDGVAVGLDDGLLEGDGDAVGAAVGFGTVDAVPPELLQCVSPTLSKVSAATPSSLFGLGEDDANRLKEESETRRSRLIAVYLSRAHRSFDERGFTVMRHPSVRGQGKP
jgi:hypothetical protein